MLLISTAASLKLESEFVVMETMQPDISKEKTETVRKERGGGGGGGGGDGGGRGGEIKADGGSGEGDMKEREEKKVERRRGESEVGEGERVGKGGEVEEKNKWRQSLPAQEVLSEIPVPSPKPRRPLASESED